MSREKSNVIKKKGFIKESSLWAISTFNPNISVFAFVCTYFNFNLVLLTILLIHRNYVLFQKRYPEWLEYINRTPANDFLPTNQQHFVGFIGVKKENIYLAVSRLIVYLNCQ